MPQATSPTTFTVTGVTSGVILPCPPNRLTVISVRWIVPGMGERAVIRQSAYGWLLVLCLCLVSSASAQGPIKDPQLEAVIKAVLKIKQIDKPQVEEADLKSIFILDARNKGIKDLSGLEKCPNLVEVKLNGNEIVSLSPLAECKNLQSLYLSSNQVSDLNPLAGLVKLQHLELEKNQLVSLTGLQSLENLRSLYISDNQITSLEPLAGLKKLTSLLADNNQITDLSPVQAQRWLSTLRLRGNKVTDLAPLTHLNELRYTFLEGNPLQDLAPLIAMAQKDIAGEQRFAPYWRLYLDAEKLPEPAKAQVAELAKLGVRVNPQ
ncbi:MAG: leucine-rich repeat domain-containing protein [Planctomycetota bacterium]|nr:MAG: leucine-rich repeat domain-containing protein [Planctomycetota bacterium]